MNYLVINGIKSDSVEGLMIQSLPPISKPLMRTSVEEIGGRDGDIVTTLGYAAYDKEVTIGLHGNFNVDDAISYFSKSGQVVFSNEPDKYYNFEIIQQIDFEKLLRFRTAKVKFHVQPFKYSDVDKLLKFENNFITKFKYTNNMNGISVSSNGNITLKGTATQATEFYLPIKPITLAKGEYTLYTNSIGISNGCALRLIADSPSNSKSFGNNYISLANNKTVSLVGTSTGNLTYNYVWLYIQQGTKLDADIEVELKSQTMRDMVVTNRGNTISRPKVTVYGSGEVTLSLNSSLILSMNIDDDYIVIDSENMNAYHEETLKNRQVKGDYANLFLNSGKNVFSWTGNVDEVIIEDFTRWI